MALIVEEEKLQLLSIQQEIKTSSEGLDELKDEEEFVKQNEQLKKDIEKVQLNLKITKQGKFKRDLIDFEKGEIFDLTTRRGRNKSTTRVGRSQSRSRRRKPQSDSEDDPTKTVIFLDEQGEVRATTQFNPQNTNPT